MKIFVFTYDRYETITTTKMLESVNLDYTALCHTEEQKTKFIEAGNVAPDKIIATGEPKGLANNRNIALDMMDEGEWALFLVDDFKKITELEGYDAHTDDGFLNFSMATQAQWVKAFKHEIGFDRFVKRAEESIKFAERLGSKLVGFCGIDNAIYRRKQWKLNVLADGRAWAVRKSQIRFDTNAQMVDDLAWTAENIRHHKVVVVNQWVLPDCKRYTKGAYGSIDERLTQRKKECAYLVEKYPDLLAFKKKAGWPAGSHIAFRPSPLWLNRI